MQRPGDTLARVQKTIGDQKYQVEFIKGAIVSCYGETRAEIKAAMLLLQKMRKDSLAEPSHFADGFESVCNKIQKGRIEILYSDNRIPNSCDQRLSCR